MSMLRSSCRPLTPQENAARNQSPPWYYSADFPNIEGGNCPMNTISITSTGGTAPLVEGPAPRRQSGPSIFGQGTDGDLIRAAQSGDHEAFAELCRRHTRV